MKLAQTTFQNRNLATRTKFASVAGVITGLLLVSATANAYLTSDLLVHNPPCSPGQVKIVTPMTTQVSDKDLSLLDWVRSKAFGVKKTVTFYKVDCKSPTSPAPKPKCFSSAKLGCDMWGEKF